MREVVNFLRRKVLARPYQWRCQQPSSGNMDARLHLLVVSHEASLTGAPKIILQLLKSFSKTKGVECTSILHNGGPLTAEFAKYGDLYCLETKRKSTQYLQRMVNRIVNRVSGNVPTVALVNSAESRFIAKALHNRSVPIVSLIHELPNSYSPEDFQLISDVSDSVIFPANIVRESALDFASFRPDQTSVVPQGLLDSRFGTRLEERECRSEVRKELGISSDAKIVLGCGTLDLRKGFDFFANIASSFVRKHGEAVDTHFVWLGEGIRFRHSPFHFVMIDVQKSGIEKNIHFVGERMEVEPFFTAADATLMVSREDPFPCVVHESMASGNPVIAFDRAGGAPEAIGDGAGIVVPYGDCEKVTHELHQLLTMPEHHQQIVTTARERIRTKYDFARYFETINQLVHQTAGLEVGSAQAFERRAAA